MVRVNVTDEQVENKIDEALYFWQDYHYDGTERAYMPIQIEQEDVDNKYVTVPEEVIGVNRVIHIGMAQGLSTNLLSLSTQLRLSVIDMFTNYDRSFIPYYMAMSHIHLANLLLSPEPAIEFNRHVDKVYIQTRWGRFNVGEYIVLDVRKVLSSTQMWEDLWLQRYATALVKLQWGQNLSKWTGVQMPGSVTINGKEMKDEAKEEILQLETMLKERLQEPLGIYVG